MSDSKGKTKQTRRYLMEIRGVLHVDAPNGEAARAAVRAWITTVSASTAAQTGDDRPAEAAFSIAKDAPMEPVVRVSWLRPHPED